MSNHSFFADLTCFTIPAHRQTRSLSFFLITTSDRINPRRYCVNVVDDDALVCAVLRPSDMASRPSHQALLSSLKQG